MRDRGNDIALLARKFAADFAEKYHTPTIQFDDSARRLMMQYRWPGNVRQLKNIVEQIALFEAGSQISADNIESYIPQNATVYTPTVASKNSSSIHSYDDEREILFNMIFRLQREIETLKTIVNGANPAPTALLDSHHKPSITDNVSRMKYSSYPSDVVSEEEIETHEINEVESHEIASSMTLEDTEKETIRRSLERNGGRRKATARELNISERTLYRKIKEYGLE